MNITIRSLLLCLILLSSSVGIGYTAKANEHSATFTQQKQHAQTVLDNKDYATAFRLYATLLLEHPTDHDVNLGLAWAAYSAQRYPHAVLAYERLLEVEPQNARYRLQLAYVYASMGNMENARYHLNLAKQYDPTITAELTKHSKTQQPPSSPWHFTGKVSTGLLYDSNANQGPKSNILTLGTWSDVSLNHVKDVSSFGQYSSMNLEGRYRLPTQNNWWIVGDINAYERWNFSSSLPANNKLLWGRTAAGILYTGDRIQTDLRIKVEAGNQHHRRYADQTVSSAGPELITAVKVAGATALVTRAGYEHREYTNPTYNSGDYWYVGEYLYQRFYEDKLGIFLGGRIISSDARRESGYSYLGWEGGLRLQAKLPYDLELMPFVLYREEHYNGPATPLETSKRRDQQWRLGNTVTWNFTKNWGWDIGYQYVHTHSNSALYCYEEQQVTTGITWKF